MDQSATMQGWNLTVTRWLNVAAVLLIISTISHSFSWTLLVALQLVAGSLAIQFFSPEAFRRWSTRGYLIVAEVLLVTLALLGAGLLPPLLYAAFFSVLLASVLASDRLKAALSSGAALGLLASVAASGTVPLLTLGWGSALFLPFCVTAILHFNGLAANLQKERAQGRAAQETDDLRALLAITETIGNTLDVNQVMRSIVNRVGEMVETDSCSIVLADKNNQNCYVMASKGHPEVDMLELNLDNYPEIRQALETSEPVLICDVDSSALIEPAREVLLAKGYRSLLVVPLVYQDAVLGTLILRSRRLCGFTQDDLRFCKVVAGSSANALKNALLFEDIKLESARNQSIGEKLRRVLDCTPDMILATDTEEKVTEVNRGAEELLDREAALLKGEPLGQVLGNDFETSTDHRGIQEYPELSLKRGNGELVQVNLVSAPLKDGAGEYAGRVWIGRDVTKLRRVEKSLAQADRLSSLGEIVAGVAHELNNPLSGVVGYAELLRLNAKHPDQIRDLDRIVESAMRCQKIVLKLLGFSRKHRCEKKYQSVNDCVAKVLDLKTYHMRSSQIEPALELDPDLPKTSFDFHQLEQVILNLLNNAEHAISSIKRPGKIVLRTGMKNERIFIEVEDNGPGVPQTIMDRIFDPFFTTKEVGMGTGLGLSISYGLIEEHGGRIELRSAKGESGALFTIWLPVVEGQPEEAAETRAEVRLDARPLESCRILVVEDEQVVLDVFSRVLEQEGAHVSLTHDGQEAWELLQRESFDLIIADLLMPKVTGQQLYERAAEERPELLRRFVFATGDLARPETVSFLETVPNRFMTKPLEVETVRQVIVQAISQVLDTPAVEA